MPAPAQNYIATANYFEQRAAKAREPSQRERMRKAAAEYRARAREQAEGRPRSEPSTATSKPN
jgi:hypothetical protein